MLFLLIVLHQKVKRDPEMKKKLCFWDSWQSLRLSLNHQSRNDAIWWFSGLIRFEPFFGHLLFLLEKKTKSIRFCTKFYVKVPTIFRPKCSGLLLQGKPVQRNLRHFFNSFRKQFAFEGLAKLNDLAQMLFLLIICIREPKGILK